VSLNQRLARPRTAGALAVDGHELEGAMTRVEHRTDLGGQLDRDGQALLLFNPKGTDDHLCIGLQSAHTQALVNAEHPVSATNQPPLKTGHSLGLLFFNRHRFGLSQDSREKYSLSYGRSWLVSIHLLTVSSLGLEIRR